MFSNVILVVFGFILGMFLAIGTDNTDLAIIEVDVVVLVNCTHIVDGGHEGIVLDQLDVTGVAKHDVVEELQ